MYPTEQHLVYGNATNATQRYTGGFVENDGMYVTDKEPYIYLQHDELEWSLA